MANIFIKMKDGTTQQFLHKDRPGGSWTVNIRYEGAFAIIRDEWEKDTAIPASDIAEIVKEDHRGRW